MSPVEGEEVPSSERETQIPVALYNARRASPGRGGARACNTTKQAGRVLRVTASQQAHASQVIRKSIATGTQMHAGPTCSSSDAVPTR